MDCRGPHRPGDRARRPSSAGAAVEPGAWTSLCESGPISMRHAPADHASSTSGRAVTTIGARPRSSRTTSTVARSAQWTSSIQSTRPASPINTADATASMSPASVVPTARIKGTNGRLVSPVTALPAACGRSMRASAHQGGLADTRRPDDERRTGRRPAQPRASAPIPPARARAEDIGTSAVRGRAAPSEQRVRGPSPRPVR